MIKFTLFLIILFSTPQHVAAGSFSTLIPVKHPVHSSAKDIDLWPYAPDEVPVYDGHGEYIICVDEANVYGGPEATREVQYTLPRGTEVNVRERAKWTEEGWAMIRPAYWVSANDLCERLK